MTIAKLRKAVKRIQLDLKSNGLYARAGSSPAPGS